MRLTPRGGADRVDGVVDGLLAARVRAAPVDGAANVALVALLARSLGLPPSVVAIERGHTGRRKVVRIGVDAATILAAWPGLVVAGS